MTNRASDHQPTIAYQTTLPMLRSLDWKFIVSLVISLAGIVVPLWLWHADQIAHALRLQVISTTALNPQAAPTFGGLKLTLDGQELRNPYFTVLEFLNTGSRPLLRSDFESPLEISMRLPAKIVRVEGAAVTPSDLKPILTIKDGQILLQPLLLNSDDKFRVTVLSTGGMPQVAIKGRIAGISKIDFIARTDDQTLSGTWLKALVGILLMIIYFSLGFDAAYQHCYLRKFRPLQLVVGAVCVVLAEPY